MTRVSRSRLSPFATAALSYAGRGWPVLPLVPGQKIPLSGKSTPGFPEDGLLSATTELSQILEWWTLQPRANVGLRTGIAFDVLDFDSTEAITNLALYCGQEPTPKGPVSATGKGTHWLFAPTGHRNSTGLLPKLDYRGLNGYIVAPPSVHPSGLIYYWAVEPTLAIPVAPAWLLRLLDEKQPPKSTYVAPAPMTVRRGGVEIVDPAWLRQQAEMTETEDIIAVAMELGYHVTRSNKTKCPFHNGDSAASLQLYPRDNSFYCFGCNAVGFSKHLRQGKPIHQ